MCGITTFAKRELSSRLLVQLAWADAAKRKDLSDFIAAAFSTSMVCQFHLRRQGMPRLAPLHELAADLSKSFHLRGDEVRDRPVTYPLLRPVHAVVAVYRARCSSQVILTLGGHLGEADKMLVMAIHERWDGRLANHIQAPPNQREVLLGEVDNTR